MQKTFFKKIIPSMLIVAILATGFFGAVGVGVVNAEEDSKSKSVFGKALDLNQTAGNVIAEASGLNSLIAVTNIPFKWVSEQAEKLMSGFAMGMTYVTGSILGISGVLFDHVIELTVTNFKGSLDEGVITEGWKIFRDLSNIIIIFALLVIGIATILRMENYGYKKLLGKLIVVAILINFSMFFTNIVIDSSNLLALQFYKTAQSTGYGSISKAYQQAFKLGTLYDIQTENGKTTVEIFSTKTSLGWYQILIVGTLASIMFLIVAFAFFAVSLMFVVRYVALVFLIILSPLAFVGMILPKTQNLASKWWSNLFSYAIFAPVYLLLTWFTVKFINSSAFQQGIGLENNMRFSETTKSGAEAVGNIPLFLNFAIIIALIIGSLILAKQMGGYGSSTIISWGQSARKWGQGMVGGIPGRFARTTVGRGVSKLASSKGLKDRAASGRFSKMFLKGVQGVAGSSFGAGKSIGKGGYEAKLKQQVKAREEFAESLGKETIEEKQQKRDLREKVNVAESAFKDANTKEQTLRIEMERAVLPETKEAARVLLQAATAEKEAAQKSLEVAQDKEREFKPGQKRQEEFAEILEKEKTIDTAFFKVTRKNKEAAQKIRENIVNKGRKRILDELQKELETTDEQKPKKETKS